MPNRLIKETIHTSEDVNRMTDFQFRLWISLIVYVDDYGRGDARPAIIKGSCFPLRERLTLKDIEQALTGLADIGCVSLYTVDGKPFLCLPSWENHQQVRNKRSKFPAPEDADLQAIDINCNQLISIDSKCSRNPIQSNPNPNPNPKAASGATEFEKAFEAFAEMRKKIRAPLTDAAREQTVKELQKLAPDDETKQAEILLQSVQRGWRGVFPIKDEGRFTPASGDDLPL